MPLPANAADLQQFPCATGWMRDSLMDYSRVMKPLHDKLEEVLKVVGRTKMWTAGATITWNGDDIAAFAAAHQLLTSAQTLHFPSADANICVMSDASDRGWGLVVSQVWHWIDGAPVTEQQHELLVCKSGKFDATVKS
ncbi:hypothetical protein PHMEG_00010434 [Phytophthora megakarya]|uniref:Reverse transcriptase/retrotransposon-derived protein RNase H-like domain-containing protein n=1 Tax=Phytophthora megakarya TaxID=4795 RepID=A0A225WG68_9STRA|nr:hypothetical protein PHMEG_00010434 [Phytophthora megakarya]